MHDALMGNSDALDGRSLRLPRISDLTSRVLISALIPAGTRQELRNQKIAARSLVSTALRRFS